MTDEITPEEFAKWMRPREALDLVAGNFGYAPTAASAILTRLKSGAIQSAAKSMGSNPATAPVRISPDEWKTLQMLQPSFPFWKSGDYEFQTANRHGRYTLAFFGIRFKPDDIYSWLEIPAPTTTVADGEPEASDGPPVSDADLRAWAELFARLYPDAPEATAVQSAKGFFQGKTVSRNRVRAALVNKRPRGRP